MQNLPYLTREFPGVGGVIKQRPEDFFVQEIPLYEPSGEGEHVYAEVQKIGLRELFEQLRLTHAIHKYPRQLSGGMRQRVSLIRTLVHDPSVLLMDEPFGALDALTRLQVRTDLEALWLRRRPTVLFITHSVEEAVGLSDRILVMSPSPGEVVEEIEVELPRPRPIVLGDAPEFGAYVDRIHRHFERMGVLHGTDAPVPETSRA